MSSSFALSNLAAWLLSFLLFAAAVRCFSDFAASVEALFAVVSSFTHEEIVPWGREGSGRPLMELDTFENRTGPPEAESVLLSAFSSDITSFQGSSTSSKETSSFSLLPMFFGDENDLNELELAFFPPAS
jgi:hypothetical protein